MGKTLVITGGRPLCGTVDVPSAKNSVLPLLAASVLCETPVRLKHVPQLSDVARCLAILETLGYVARQEGDDVTVRPDTIRTASLPAGPVGAMRASVLFLAPVLAKAGRVETGMPGGCRLGPRPIDIHLDGLVHMGATVKWKADRLILEAPRGLRGVDYTLRFPSVGATETLLLAAARAHGPTVLRGVACEPEVRDLADFLSACGVHISGAGSSVICVSGAKSLQGTVFTPLPDRIVAATAACAAASAGGQAVLRRCDPFAFSPVLAALRQAGCEVDLRGPDEVMVARSGELKGIGRIFTGVYPAFPTDAAPLLAAALLSGHSESSIEDTVFENRFACATGFSALGANVSVSGRAIEIRPVERLHGAEVQASDLRGGAALAVAALAAQGETKIAEAEYILRGYEDIAQLLRDLGAKAAQKNEEVS
jgi:UDP-N-acetylglucosamine 1-carboxyvinyltransferase